MGFEEVFRGPGGLGERVPPPRPDLFLCLALVLVVVAAVLVVIVLVVVIVAEVAAAVVVVVVHGGLKAQEASETGSPPLPPTYFCLLLCS